jgi:succinate dehydrogenase/fumarate reductase-like Fe-S protein
MLTDCALIVLVLVYEQYRSIEPWLQTKEGKAEGQAEFLQTREDRAKLDGMVSLLCLQITSLAMYILIFRRNLFLS